MSRRRAPTYSSDPRWITVRYRGTCSGCASPIPVGADAFYFPRTRDLFCSKTGCGQAEALDFASHACDEAVYAGHGVPFAR